MIYVDRSMEYGWKFGLSCHLVADTEKELHEFAAGLGLRREWFQDKTLPHYDLTVKKRAMAVRHGAVEITVDQLVEMIEKRRNMEGDMQ